MTIFSSLVLIFLLLLIACIFIRQILNKQKFKKQNDNNLKFLYMIKIILLILISIFLSLTFSNYTAGVKKISNYSMSIDNVLILDYSTSMIANDIKPSRFENAKNLSSFLIENSDNCRFALILFGDDPLLEVPLTDNKTHILTVLSSIQLNDDYYRASNINSALSVALSILERSPSFYKNIILFSDYDFDNILSNKIKYLIKENITNFYNIVISSEKGTKIWLQSKKAFLTDNFQNEVVTKFNPLFLADISKMKNVILYSWDTNYYNSIISIISSNKNLSFKMEKHETFASRKLNFIFGIVATTLMLIYLLLSMPFFYEIKLNNEKI